MTVRLSGESLCTYGQYRTTFLPRAAEASKELRANNFVLEDANGKPRASLGMDGDGLELRLKYGNGNIGIALCLHDDKVVLSLSDKFEIGILKPFTNINFLFF